MNLLSYLKQPFPKAENKWKTIIFVSLFVALFLIVFKPFGINLMESNYKIVILFGYGIVTFLILVFQLILLENLFSKIFDERRWTVGKEFIRLIWIIFTIGLGNAFYSAIIIKSFQFNFRFFVVFQLFTLVIGIIPITILIITKQKYLLKKNISSANDLNKSIDHNKTKTRDNHIIRFYTDNEKDYIEFDINDFFFIESSGNYIELYILKNDKMTRKTFRSTLKRSLDFFTNTPEIIQCHRAFIVHSAKITSAKGNSQGLRLKLENCEQEVPVSRNYVEAVRNQMR